MRIDKFLSDSSSYSRKEVKALIRSGCVFINGRKVRTADEKADAADEVTVKGSRIPYCRYVYLMLNKPAGYLSATEDDRDPVVTQLLPEEYRHFAPFPVGRLDKDTEGLLLLTNDGQFDHALMSPRRKIVKRYYAELDHDATPADIEAFAAGMTFQDFTAKSARLEITGDPSKVFVEISEGKYHQVKRMCEKVGKKVLYLKRVAIGELKLDETLPAGSVRPLTREELQLLKYVPET